MQAISSSPVEPTAWQRFLLQLQASSGSRYTTANLTYLFYTSIIMPINLSLSKRANDVYSDDVYYARTDPDSGAYLACVPTPPTPPLGCLHLPKAPRSHPSPTTHTLSPWQPGRHPVPAAHARPQ